MSEKIVRTTVEENDANIIKSQVMNVLDDKLIRHQVRGLDQPAPEPPVLETLNVTENGTYTPEEGVDGFDEVNVDVELHGDTAYDLKDAPSGSISTFTDGVDLPLNKLVVGIDSQSGVSECNLTRCGNNLCGGEKLADDIVSKVTYATKNTTNKTVSYSANRIDNIVLFKNFKPNTRYTIIANMYSGVTNLMIKYSDGTKTSISKNEITVSAEGKTVISLSGEWQTGDSVLLYEQFGIFEGVITAQDFKPYNGNTYNISFPSGVTISNGSIDILNGVLTDDDLSEEYNINPIAIRSLEGVNNVFADTGDIEELEYFYKIAVAGDDLISQIKVVDVEGTPTIKDIKRDFALTGNNAISITNGNIDFGSDDNCYLNCRVSQMNLIPYVIEADIVTCGFETDTENNKMRGIFTFGQNKSTLWGLFFNTEATEEVGKGTLTFRPQLNQSSDSEPIAPSDFEGKTLKLYCNCGLDSDNNIIYDKNNALIFLDDDVLINGDFSNYAGENWGEMCSMGWSSYNWGCPGLVISEYRVKELSTLLGGVNYGME